MTTRYPERPNPATGRPTRMTQQRVLLSWSSGKDSAWTLSTLQQDPDVKVVGLLTTFNETADRVAMHAVRRDLVQMQAKAAGLPLHPVELPWPCPNGYYESAMSEALEALRPSFDTIAFGDLFLEDIRDYRISTLQPLGIEPVFPLWLENTVELAQAMIAGGLVAHLTFVDPKQCPAELAGRRFDLDLLDDLPESVDPCGENGEFHTFVSAGPMFREPIPVTTGEIVERDGFVFADVAAG